MRILTFDTEHSYGPLRSYNEGFYLSCVCAMDNYGWEKTWWFDHSSCNPTQGDAFVDKIQEIQDQIDRADVVVAHNAKHDVTIMRAYGITFENTKLHCTQVGEYILNGQNKTLRYNLNETALRHGLEPKQDVVKTAYWDKGIDTYDVPAFILEPYCKHDVELTHSIYLNHISMIRELNLQKVIDLQMEFILSLSDMEFYGLKWDMERAEAIVKEYQDKADIQARKFRDMCGLPYLNMNSTIQIGKVLYGGEITTTHVEWVITTYRTKPYSHYGEKNIKETVDYAGFGFVPDLPKWKLKNRDNWKTDAPTLEKLKCRTPEQKKIKAVLMEYRKLQKVVETLLGAKKATGLINKVCFDGHLHPDLNQTVTATGRLSSSNPNGQNLPRGNTSPIKECIIPVFDEIMQYDLSQIEWRAAAYLAQDEAMIHEINSGIDQHAAACVDLMQMPLNKDNRTDAKIFNFRMIYDGTFWGFYNDQKMPDFSKKKWQNIIRAFWEKYFGLRNYIDKNVATVWREKGLLVSPTGRFWHFNKTKKGDYNSSQVANYPVQGLAGADILPLLTVIIRRGMIKKGLKSRMILTVHDSIVFDVVRSERDELAKLCHQVGELLPKYIESYYGFKFNVKLEGEVEVGPNYGSIQKIEVG